MDSQYIWLMKEKKQKQGEKTDHGTLLEDYEVISLLGGTKAVSPQTEDMHILEPAIPLGIHPGKMFTSAKT